MIIVWIMSYLFTFLCGGIACLTLLTYIVNRRDARALKQADASDKRWGDPSLNSTTDDDSPVRTDV